MTKPKLVTQPSAAPTRKVVAGAIAGMITAVGFNLDYTQLRIINHEQNNRNEESEGYSGFIMGTAVIPYGTSTENLLAVKRACLDASV